jgi:hypothetical protein
LLQTGIHIGIEFIREKGERRLQILKFHWSSSVPVLYGITGIIPRFGTRYRSNRTP